MPPSVPTRSTFTTLDTITHLWTALCLPAHALTSLSLPHADTLGLPSSYKIGHLAQSSIALSALAAALVDFARRTNAAEDEDSRTSLTLGHSTSTKPAAHASASASASAPTPTSTPLPTVTVPLQHACIEFASERLYTLSNRPPSWPRHAVGGLHRAANGGHVRIHDGFPHHRANALKLLGCAEDATREQVAQAVLQWDAVDLESRAIECGAVAGALRSVEQWALLEQAQAMTDAPVRVRRVMAAGAAKAEEQEQQEEEEKAGASKGWKPRLVDNGGERSKRSKALQGVRVLEFSRVIAAPVAGRTLAAHGADVLWVTSPKLPDLPVLDVDLARGKRSVQLDLDEREDGQALEELCEDVDVVIQGYRPGALAQKGLSVETLASKSKNGVVHASLSAYGSRGPWNHRRGFDSIVQTQSGLNVSEAEHFGQGEASKVLPCQALDHASGYLLAFGIMAALYRQATEGGSYAVEVSLAGTMKYLASLGQYEGKSGFHCQNYLSQQDLPAGILEAKESELGLLTAVKHSASIEGMDVGWGPMPQKPFGSSGAKWL